MADKNLGISVLLDHYGAMLTDKQRDVIDLYYNQDLSLAEIAEHEGISRQGVRDNIKRGEAFLLEMEEKLHLAQKMGICWRLLRRSTNSATRSSGKTGRSGQQGSSGGPLPSGRCCRAASTSISAEPL